MGGERGVLIHESSPVILTCDVQWPPNPMILLSLIMGSGCRHCSDIQYMYTYYKQGDNNNLGNTIQRHPRQPKEK